MNTKHTIGHVGWSPDYQSKRKFPARAIPVDVSGHIEKLNLLAWESIESLLSEEWDGRNRIDLSEREDRIFVYLLNEGYMGIRSGIIFHRTKKK